MNVRVGPAQTSATAHCRKRKRKREREKEAKEAKEAKGRRGEEDKEAKRERGKKGKEEEESQRMEMLEKCKEIIIGMSLMGAKKGEQEKERRKNVRRPTARQTLGELEKWLFLFLLLGKNWLRVSAAAEGPQRRKEAVMRMQQEVRITESSWRESAEDRCPPKTLHLTVAFMNTFPVDMRMKFVMTRQHVAVCSTRRSQVTN